MRLQAPVYLVAATCGPVGVAALQGLGDDIVGFGPYCTTSCTRALAGNYLGCSFDGYVPGGMMTTDAASATPACRGNNEPFLTSLAYCISTHCDLDIPTLEAWWLKKSPGSGGAYVPPMWSYQEALSHVNTTPTVVAMPGVNLTSTMLANEESYKLQYGTLSMVDYEEFLHGKFGLVILMLGFGIPLLVTWFHYLPYATSLVDKVKPCLIWPSTIGTYHMRPLPFLLGYAPTRGQGIYIVVIVVLNIVFTAVSYDSFQFNLWFPGQNVEIEAYIVWRTGCYAVALLPVMILFSSRNNTLLWLTNWSHGTYLLLHRWLAGLFTLHVVLHSVIALVYYQQDGNYATNLVQDWWIWGCVGTVAVCIMVATATHWVRRVHYELFLISHIVLAVFVLAGTWYHLYDLYMNMSGYEQWMYMAFGVWGADRLFRIMRVLKNGIKHARTHEIGGDIVRIDIPNVHWASKPGQLVYVFFPKLNKLRPWGNHPFSVLPTRMLEHDTVSPFRDGEVDSASGSDIPRGHSDEKNGHREQVLTSKSGHASHDATNNGVTLFVRRSAGFTKMLSNDTDVLTLLDGPYPSHAVAPMLQCDRVLLICGGIGITAILPWIEFHPNAKLAWSVKESARPLVQAIETALARVAEKTVSVGDRLDIARLVEEEASDGWHRIGVVVCGPSGMCDDARSIVATAARNGAPIVELDVHAYSW